MTTQTFDEILAELSTCSVARRPELLRELAACSNQPKQKAIAPEAKKLISELRAENLQLFKSRGPDYMEVIAANCKAIRRLEGD